MLVAAAEFAMDGGDTEVPRLLAQAKSGDLGAFEQILILHQRQVYLTALRLLGRREDAQDAAQEVFLRLHRHLRRFDDSRQPRAHLERAPEPARI